MNWTVQDVYHFNEKAYSVKALITTMTAVVFKFPQDGTDEQTYSKDCQSIAITGLGMSHNQILCPSK